MVSEEVTLDRDIALYRSVTFAQSTKRTYASHKRAYFKFCAAMGYNPVPVSQTVLCRYAAYLARRLAVSSIRKYLNIIRLLHLEEGFPNPLKENWFLETILRGIARKKGMGTTRKLPITPHLLLSIRGRLNLYNPVEAVFWAACLTAFFGFLRKANLFPPSVKGFDPSRHLCRQDLTLHQWGVTLHIRWSKTIQFGERALEAPLPRLVGHPLCPVAALVHAFTLTLGASLTGPAFVIKVGSQFTPFPPSKFVSLLRTHLSALGYNPNLYSGHSFRRGAASWALRNGLPGETIKILGDWKSDAYLTYLTLDHQAKLDSISVFAKSLPTT